MTTGSGTRRWLSDPIWYDGPVAGMVDHNGDTLFALWHGDDNEGRVFRLYRMPEDFDHTQMAWTFDEDGHVDGGSYLGKLYEHEIGWPDDDAPVM